MIHRGVSTLISAARSGGSSFRYERKANAAPTALTSTAAAAFQPNTFIMKAMFQPHCSATMTTGGAAKGVKVPPIETLTNRTPSVAYMNFLGALPPKNWSRNSKAVSVIAAGSVMNEPSSGPTDSSVK